MKNISRLGFLVLIIVIALGSCKKDPKKEQIKAISNLESELYGAQAMDRDKGLHMIDSYLGFSEQYPNDTLSASYLFKAGEIAMNLQLGTQAIFYYDKILSNFPSFHKIPECIFLKAFIFENQLGDLNKAKQFYEMFIERYPNHSLSNDAKASLEYLGLSPEALIKIFQEKNGEMN